MRAFTSFLGCAGLVVASAASSALAQFDNSAWPGFSGTANKDRAAFAPGPVTVLDKSLRGVGTVSPGGITVASDGRLYFKNQHVVPPMQQALVIGLDPATGCVFATSPTLGPGAAGDHGGVAVGVDALYVPIYDGVAGQTRIQKLNKTTLAIISTFTDPTWMGIRGTPMIGNVPNNLGHVNIYVVDRDGAAIRAIDSVTGAQQWSFPYGGHVLSQLGPLWTDGGRDTVAYFNNSDLGNAVALRDNGDGTVTNLWPVTAGPGNFNWWGSGALSADSARIYVNTFNDNLTPTLWALSITDGSILWGVDGMRGTPDELNFFGRPAIVGSRIYCGGGDGVVACFTDNGASFTQNWVYRDHNGEHTSIAAVETAGGQTYVYTVKQELFNAGNPTGLGELLVFRDDGASFTLLMQTTLSSTLRFTLFGNSSTTVDGAGRLWVGAGRRDDAALGDIFKFALTAPCPADFNRDGVGNSQDFFDYLAAFFQQQICADFNVDGVVNSQDFFDFLAAFFNGC